MPSVFSDVRFFPSKGHKPWRIAAFSLLALPFLVGLVALYLGQDANWDLRNYHWYNAYALLNGRYGMDLLPSQIPFFYNPALDVPFYLLATHVSARWATFVLGSVQGLNVLLLFMLAHACLVIHNPQRKVLAALGLAVLGLLGGGGIAQIGTTFYDNITSLGVFASALLIIRFMPTLFCGSTRRAAVVALLAGIPVGLTMGLKLPCVIFCVGLCGALLFTAGSWQRRLWIGFFFGIGILLGLSLSFGPWGLYLETQYGNPFFPYFNGFFRGPLGPLDDSARDVHFVPQGLWKTFVFPFSFLNNPFSTGEIPWRDIRLPVLYGLMPLAAFARLAFGHNPTAPDRVAAPLAARYLLWTTALTYAVWVKLFAIYRYIIPLEMLAPLLIVLAIGMLPVRPSARNLLTGFTLVVVAFCVQPGNWTRRDTYLDHFVEVSLPPLPVQNDWMLLMAGVDPYAHLLPAFPPEIPVVRIQSNFARPDKPLGMNDLIRARLQAHQGPFKLLIPNHQITMAKSALAAYGLVFLPQSCQKVTDHLYRATLVFCDVRRRQEQQPQRP